MVWDAEWCEEDNPKYRDECETPRKRGSVMGVPERQTKTWNGVPVKSMESSHIMNSILYCERKYIEGWSNHKGCHGDKEDFYFLSVYEMFPEYINLRDEWKRRLA